MTVGERQSCREPALALVKTFDPLKEFKVVLVFHAHETVDRGNLVDFFLLKDGLQQLEILENVVAELGVSDYFLEVDGIRIQRFHNHAIRSAVAALLDFGVPKAKIR